MRFRWHIAGHICDHSEPLCSVMTWCCADYRACATKRDRKRCRNNPGQIRNKSGVKMWNNVVNPLSRLSITTV